MDMGPQWRFSLRYQWREGSARRTGAQNAYRLPIRFATPPIKTQVLSIERQGPLGLTSGLTGRPSFGAYTRK